MGRQSPGRQGDDALRERRVRGPVLVRIPDRRRVRTRAWLALAVPFLLGAATTGIGPGSVRSLAVARPTVAPSEVERVLVVRASRSEPVTTAAAGERVRPVRGAVTSPF